MLVVQKEVFKKFWYLMPLPQMLEQHNLVHLIVKAKNATPTSDRLRCGQRAGTHVVLSQTVQLGLRNNTEADTRTEELIAFDCEASRRHRVVTWEDLAVLETTDYDVLLDLKQKQYTTADKPGILRRKKSSRLLAGNR